LQAESPALHSVPAATAMAEPTPTDTQCALKRDRASATPGASQRQNHCSIIKSVIDYSRR
jgi:hypothetical protein